jgi:hypothetical protein
MSTNRVKIIAGCVGGWVLVSAAYVSCGLLVLPEPRYKCPTVATNPTWVNKLASIVVDNTDPGWCPVIIETGVGTVKQQSYASNVKVNTSAIDPARQRIEYAFHNANNTFQRAGVSNLTNTGTGVMVTTAVGAYTAGTAGNVTTKRDFVHNRVYTTEGVATGDIYLDYNYHANPTMSGVTSQANGAISMRANTPRVQQPVTYQWWINGVSQGLPSGSNNYYQTKGTVVTRVGVYGFKAVIIDKNKRSYTVTRSVTVTAVCATGKIC